MMKIQIFVLLKWKANVMFAEREVINLLNVVIGADPWKKVLQIRQNLRMQACHSLGTQQQ